MFSSSSSGSEAGVRCREPGSLTGQNAEPVGMKLTLFLSGQEKSGTDADVDCLELQKNTYCVVKDHTLLRNKKGVKFNSRIKQFVPHLLKSFYLLTALWWFSLEHVTVVGFGRGGKLRQR